MTVIVLRKHTHWVVFYFCLLAGVLIFEHPLYAQAPTLREALAEVLPSDTTAHDRFFNQLAAAEKLDDTTRNLLILWRNEELMLYTDAAGKAIPVSIDTPDANGKSHLFSVATGQALNDAAGAPVLAEASALTPIDSDATLRKKIQRAMDLADISSANPDTRKLAARKLGTSQRKENLSLLEARLLKESDKSVRKSLAEACALIRLTDFSSPKTQIAAANELAELDCLGATEALRALAANDQMDISVRKAAAKAQKSIRDYKDLVNFFGTIFRGTSLGSILLVAALGLAVTFGLMGIINMAHGEMITVGAYAAYVVENIFRNGLALSPLGIPISIPGMHAGEGLFQWYFAVAIPVSFCAAALAGLIIERLVICHLYQRALESLLATWGISLVLQQLFRVVFGANNVQVNSPSWLMGNFTVSDVTLGYNRLFVIAFAVLIVVGTWLLLSKTRLGLLIRSVTQDRDMAACMGVPTRRVNMLTFAFGSGLAGLAGAFLSQIGNVGPGLGQNFIVDNFMTVVVGGVGSIVGTVISALSIGISDQVLQQILESPVLGKIMVLIAIILFLQWKPSGLFPTRSRSLDS